MIEGGKAKEKEQEEMKNRTEQKGTRENEWRFMGQGISQEPMITNDTEKEAPANLTDQGDISE